MPAYDDTLFDPPAPLARVDIRNPGNGNTVPDIPMLLDSGADVTLLPREAVNELGLTTVADEVYEIMGFDGSTSHAPVVRLEMVFLSRTFRGHFLLVDQEWGIMGRDVLNLVPLLLDGPNLTWNEHG
jgi:predicted aspartyl protease